MKVVFWSPYVGHVGTIKAVINSARSFKLYGKHDVTLIKNHSEWEGYEQILRDSKIELCDFGLKRYFPGIYKTTPLGSRLYMLSVSIIGIFQMRRYIKDKKPDLIIGNLLVLPLIISTLFLRYRPKLIISIQGFPKFLADHGDDYPLWMKLEDGLRKRLWNLLYDRASILVCMTESTKRLLVEKTNLNEEKLIVVNNPIVGEDLFSLGEERLHDEWFLTGDRSVLAIGRLTKQKDFLTLIRAAQHISKDIDIRLAILGSGELKAELQQYINDNDLSDRVKLYGFVENPYKYLMNSNLFVLTSLWEDPGHVLIEAAYFKVPIVSTDCPSGPRIILSNGEGGDLCPIGDSKAIAQKMEQSLATTDPGKLQVAYNNALKFSLETHYRKLAEYVR